MSVCIECQVELEPKLWPALCWVCDVTQGPFCHECYNLHFAQMHPDKE